MVDIDYPYFGSLGYISPNKPKVFLKKFWFAVGVLVSFFPHMAGLLKKNHRNNLWILKNNMPCIIIFDWLWVVR